MKKLSSITAITMLLLLVVAINSCSESNNKKAQQAEKTDAKAVSSEGTLVMATIDAGGATFTL